MATVINNPTNQGADEGLGIGLIVGILAAVLAAVLLFMYGVPMLRGIDEQPAVQKIEVQLPAVTPLPKTTE